MTKKEKITDQISRMDRIIGWVKVCDDKTSILLSVALLVPTVTIGTDWVLEKIQGVFSLFVSACKEHGEGYNFSIPNFISIILLITTLVFFALCLIKFINVLKAKIDENAYSDDTKQDSLIHFNNLSKIDNFEAYKQMVCSETDDLYYEDLLSQTYINAKRCAEKFIDYNSGVCWLCWAIVSLVVFVVSLIFITI